MLSINISWRDRDKPSRSLPMFLQTALPSSGEVAIANYGGSDARLSTQIDGLTWDIFRVARVGESTITTAGFHD